MGKERSIRRKCRVLGVRRQTYHSRKAGKRPEEADEAIRMRLHSLASLFVAWGFWMIFYYLRNQGFTWNHKRVYRIWKEEGLNLRKEPKRPKIRREYLDLLAPNEINAGWAMDFLSEWVVGEQGQSVRIINIVDECSRRALWTEAHMSITGATLTDILDKVVKWRGKPAYIRCDNGPEFIGDALKEWAGRHKIELRHIQPGKPSQNGIIERLNGTLRRECLNLEWFPSLEYLNEKIQQWCWTYNEQRPHSSLKRISPSRFEDKNNLLYFRPVAA